VNEPNVKELFDSVGGVNWISKRLNQPYNTVKGWEKRNKVPAEKAKEIEERTNALLTKHQLRPDLFGEAPKKK
jgi:hypothetical protein